MSKRGVTVDEKRTRMMQLLYEKKEFFQLKDLEKIAPQEKGIIANSVKDVVQQLVDDGSIDSGKIGSSTYYWAFPSKVIVGKKRKLTELNDQHLASEKRLKVLTEKLGNDAGSKEDVSKKENLMETLTKLHKQHDELSKRVQSLTRNDLVKYKQQNANMEELRDAVNRWTDNISMVTKWCSVKFSMEKSDLNKQFGIPEELDYVE